MPALSLSLLGPGGIGKTRLALQAASLLTKKNRDVFADGISLVSLAPLNSPDSLIPAIAKALNFSFYKEEEKPQQQLYDYLREKRMLLVLDNFEHLIDEDSTRSLLDLLSVAPGVRSQASYPKRLQMPHEREAKRWILMEPSDLFWRRYEQSRSIYHPIRESPRDTRVGKGSSLYSRELRCNFQ